MYKRAPEAEVLSAARKYRGIVLLGPRQSGKTTLARGLFPRFRYVSLEDPELRRLAMVTGR